LLVLILTCTIRLKVWWTVAEAAKAKDEKKGKEGKADGAKEEKKEGGGGGGGGGKKQNNKEGGGGDAEWDENAKPNGGGGGGGGGGEEKAKGGGGENGGEEKPKGGGGNNGGGPKPKEVRKEAKADMQPGPPRPSLITVPEADFTVKETNPDLGKAVDYRQHFDLVEQMSYLFIRVVRARGLMGKDANGLSDPVRVSSQNATLDFLKLSFLLA
jgi:hypothetical protein